ncbi:hypothetical protein B0H12DRAFT_305133 [Mycena haematopus]|nr:hypothetical protein B0H12DRAFT_305133 [Mycena haematopus]
MSSSPQSIPRSCPHCQVPFDTPPGAIKPSHTPRDILNTNRPPTDSEIRCIQSTLDEKRARKIRLEVHIAAVQSLLAELGAERDNVEAEIRIHEGAVSPLRQMPTELLSLIFGFVSRERENPAPLAASQVCSRWRAIELAKPWASMDLDFSKMKPEDRKTRTPSRLEAQLNRAANSPPINFVCDRSTGQEFDLLAVLVQHCARWEEDRIHIPASRFSDLAPIHNNLPLLRKLEVSSWRPRSQGAPEPLLNVFEFAPSLREASVNFENRSTETARVLLPFSGLQRYAARGTWNTQLSVLRLASNLVDCALDVVHIFTPPPALIVLPHLLRLSLWDARILDCLDTPQLEELYCYSYDQLLPIITRRRPQRLQKLGLMFAASAAQISGILRSVPTITELGIFANSDVADSFDDICASLLLRDVSTGIAPALTSIIIGSSGHTIFSNRYNRQTLTDMVTSRWQIGKLRSIHIPNKKYSKLGDGRFGIGRLQGDGLVVTDHFRNPEAFKTMVPSHLRFDTSHLDECNTRF